MTNIFQLIQYVLHHYALYWWEGTGYPINIISRAQHHHCKVNKGWSGISMNVISTDFWNLYVNENKNKLVWMYHKSIKNHIFLASSLLQISYKVGTISLSVWLKFERFINTLISLVCISQVWFLLTQFELMTMIYCCFKIYQNEINSLRLLIFLTAFI